MPSQMKGCVDGWGGAARASKGCSEKAGQMVKYHTAAIQSTYVTASPAGSTCMNEAVNATSDECVQKWLTGGLAHATVGE